jgi:hypothetical protein
MLVAGCSQFGWGADVCGLPHPYRKIPGWYDEIGHSTVNSLDSRYRVIK